MICILTEKNSAARNFAKALIGDERSREGSYGGESFVIVNAIGHLFAFPDDVSLLVDEAVREKYRLWDIENLPWNETDIHWMKYLDPDKKSAYDNIKNNVARCSEVVIATDDDPSGEGTLLAAEILFTLDLAGKKITRMFFADESVNSIRKAFTGRVTIPDLTADRDYIKADYRSKWDYLSMQFTRIATGCVAKAAGRYVATLRNGRLKSFMVQVIGKQLDAVNSYVKKPFYQPAFTDDNGNIFLDKHSELKEKKEDVDLAPYHASEIIIDSVTHKHSAPPKLLDIAGLSARLAPKGITSKTVSSVYQKMYEDQVVSYPRTEDKEITMGQFNEMLPYIDRIAAVVGISPGLLTHRTPRSTHVKEGGAHGANRPGTNVPASLAEIETKYGRAGAEIYKVLAYNFLAMFCEDYEYDSYSAYISDYPEFKSQVNVGTKQGYKAIWNDTDEDEGEKAGEPFGKMGYPMIKEGFPPKPQQPTQKWLTKQMEKYNVGTGATRLTAYTEITDPGHKFPLATDTKGRIKLTEYGEWDYILLKDTHIGSLDLTAGLQAEMKDIADGKITDPAAKLRNVQQLVIDDIAKMRSNSDMLDNSEGLLKGYEAKEKVTGTFEGEEISFNREWGGHTFTDEEVKKLLNGEEIAFDMVSSNGSKYVAEGRLEKQKYKGRVFYGFKLKERVLGEREGYVSGTWNGIEIEFKETWSDHRFTEDEVKALLAGETISFEMVSAKGKPYTAEGRIEKQKYKGQTFYGFKLAEKERPAREGYVSGVWKKKNITFKGEWGGHTFTEEEIEALLAGKEIEFSAVSKDGNTYPAKGKLAYQTYNGTKFYGFKPDFGKSR